MRFLVAERRRPVLGFATYGAVSRRRRLCRTAWSIPSSWPRPRAGAGLGRALLHGGRRPCPAPQARIQMIAGVSGENAEGRAFHAAHGLSATSPSCPQVGFKFGRYHRPCADAEIPDLTSRLCARYADAHVDLDPHRRSPVRPCLGRRAVGGVRPAARRPDPRTLGRLHHRGDRAWAPRWPRPTAQ